MLVNQPICADWAADVEAVSAYNQESSAAIAYGRVVARSLGSTETNRALAAAQNATGVKLPSISNYDLLGIATPKNGKSAEAGAKFGVVRSGAALAAVYVPASQALSKGTLLVPATVHDATNNKTLFATSTAGANPGALEAVIYNSIVRVPANPMARLLEDLASSSAAGVRMAYVEVLPHRPRFFTRNIFVPGSFVQNTQLSLGLTFGPMIIHGMQVQARLWGSTGGGTTFQLVNAPLAGTADAQDIYSTAPYIANDASDAGNFGMTPYGVDGDNDTGVSLGTSGVSGTLGAVAQRLLCTQAALQLEMTYATVTAVTDLMISVHGEYL